MTDYYAPPPAPQPGGGGGGTTDHRALSHRTDVDQHPAAAVQVAATAANSSPADNKAESWFVALDAALTAGGTPSILPVDLIASVIDEDGTIHFYTRDGEGGTVNASALADGLTILVGELNGGAAEIITLPDATSSPVTDQWYGSKGAEQDGADGVFAAVDWAGVITEVTDQVPAGDTPAAVSLVGTGVTPTFADTIISDAFGGLPLTDFAGGSTFEIGEGAVLKSSFTAGDRRGYDLGDSDGKLVGGLWGHISWDSDVTFGLGLVVADSAGNPVAGTQHNLPGYWGGLVPGSLQFGQGTGPAADNVFYLKFTTPVAVAPGDMQLVVFGIAAPGITISAEFQPISSLDDPFERLSNILGVADPTSVQQGLLSNLTSLGDFMKSFERRLDDDRAVDTFVRPIDPDLFTTLKAGGVDPADQPFDMDGVQLANGMVYGLLSKGTNDNSGAWVVRIMGDDEANPGKHIVITDDTSTLPPDFHVASTNAIAGGCILRTQGKLAVFRAFAPETSLIQGAQDNLSASAPAAGDWLVVAGGDLAALTTRVTTLEAELAVAIPHGRSINADDSLHADDAGGVVLIDAENNDVTFDATNGSLIPAFATVEWTRTDPSLNTVTIAGTFDGSSAGVTLTAVTGAPPNPAAPSGVTYRATWDGSSWRTAA